MQFLAVVRETMSTPRQTRYWKAHHSPASQLWTSSRIAAMSPGVPVATVGIGAAKNAGLLAVQFLAVGDARLQKALAGFKQKLATESHAKNESLAQ